MTDIIETILGVIFALALLGSFLGKSTRDRSGPSLGCLAAMVAVVAALFWPRNKG